MKTLLVLLAGSILLIGGAHGKDIEILVADKQSKAYQHARSMQNNKTLFAEKSLKNAAKRISRLIGEACPVCPPPRTRGLPPPPCHINKADFCTINVKVAEGVYKGFSLPEIKAPETTLRFIGGYNDQFTRREPFKTASILVGSATPVELQGKWHALKEFVLSGFVMDTAAGNKYDARTNSLLKGNSASQNIVTVGYLTTDRLLIADNVMMNSSHKAAAPLIRAMSPNATIEVRNNIIMNNVLAWEADSSRFQNKPASYKLVGNTWVMNWPYNPDATTSNPAALEVGGRDVASKVIIDHNLFAYNMGGAIYPKYNEASSSEWSVSNNLFYKNGALFGNDGADAGAMVAKFGEFKSRYIPWNEISVEEMEDEYEFNAEGNIVFDPQIEVALVKPGFGNSNDVSAKASVMNDMRSLLGQNLQGNTMKISNYAPRMALDLDHLPFARAKQAQAYGASADRVTQY